MSRFVQISDFETGSTKIEFANEYRADDFQSYLDEYEQEILEDMLGCELYQEFISDYDSEPVNEFSEQRFIKIYNAFCRDKDLCSFYRSKGINYMLVHMIYYIFVADEDITQRTEGFGRGNNENAERLPASMTSIFNKYNKGISTYKAIQDYICLNPDNYDYDNFQGIKKQYSSWL